MQDSRQRAKSNEPKAHGFTGPQNWEGQGCAGDLDDLPIHCLFLLCLPPPYLAHMAGKKAAGFWKL